MSGKDGGACKPGCKCRRHANGGVGYQCPSGCKCGRHSPVHKPGCICPIHRSRSPRAAYKPKGVPRRRGHAPKESVCLCTHVDTVHDMFGCKTCDKHVNNNVLGATRCHEFRSRAGYPSKTETKAFGGDLKVEGFIKHEGDLATCTVCWMVVKLGVANTLTSVINARAHKQLCKDHVRPEQERDRPEPGEALG